MKLTAKLDYALKAAIELSIQYHGEKPVSLEKIASSESIPKKYLIQLLFRLKNGDIIRTVRGVAGGYYLAQPPSKISIADIFRAIDKDFLSYAENATLREKASAGAIVARIWNEVNGCVAKKLEALTLEDLARQITHKQPNYSI